MSGPLLGALGLIGAFLMVSMYAMLEARRIKSTSPVFYLLNGLGALLVLASLAADFDPGDLGGVVTEGAWLIISIVGLIKVLRRRNKLKTVVTIRRTKRQRTGVERPPL